MDEERKTYYDSLKNYVYYNKTREEVISDIKNVLLQDCNYRSYLLSSALNLREIDIITMILEDRAEELKTKILLTLNDDAEEHFLEYVDEVEVR